VPCARSGSPADLHLVTGEGGNVALYVTGAGVVLVDGMFYRNHEDLVAVHGMSRAPADTRMHLTSRAGPWAQGHGGGDMPQ
jgi:hypothetical protein